MNNYELIKELKRIRFRNAYEKLEYIRPMIDHDKNDFELISERYLSKIKRFINDDHNLRSHDYNILMTDLKEQLCYELKVFLFYSTGRVNFSTEVGQILFDPDNLDEITLTELSSIALEFVV